MILVVSERNVFEHLSVSDSPVTGEVRIVSDPEERSFFRRTLVRFERCDIGPCPEKRILWQAPLSFQEVQV